MADLPVSDRFSPLHEDDLGPDPIVEVRRWYEAACQLDILQPDAMALATSTPQGRPTVRMVLLKAIDDDGIVFYTNLASRKAQELADNPFASAVMWWPPQNRQIRVEGMIERVDDARADAYFSKRPRASQLGAWISNQSAAVTREDLDSEWNAAQSRFEGRSIPRPEHWGGYRIIADAVEFWQGREGRLHDRLRYRGSAAAGWIVERLAP